MMPVPWEPVDEAGMALPDNVPAVSDASKGLGVAYDQEGLRRLSALPGNRERYEMFVAEFAKALVENAKEHPLPPLPNIPSPEDIQSAFARPDARAPRQRLGSRASGLRLVQFCLAVGTEGEMKSVRSHTDFYKQHALDWQPYLPTSAQRVVTVLQKVAAEQSIFFEILSVEENFVRQIREAEEMNYSVIIVLDPWILKLGKYKGYMLEYDLNRFTNSGVLVLWNMDDSETLERENELRSEVRETLALNFSIETSLIRHSIRSFVELNTEATILINHLRSLLSK
jgi:FxsC-like protein